MSGNYSTKPTYFINLDLIGWIEPIPAAEYPVKLLQFFADVERDWVAMGGLPHNGKMYGFYDPNQPAGTRTLLRSTGTSSRCSASFEASG